MCFLLSTIGGQYITLYGLQFWLRIAVFWPAPDGPVKCYPSVRSESEESLKAPTEIVSEERQNTDPISIQVLIRLRKGVRIGFLQTSKNWESLEVGFIIKIKSGLKRLSHSLFFL